MEDEYNVIIDGRKLKKYPKFDECYIDPEGQLWSTSSGKLEQTRKSWEKRRVRKPVYPARIVPKSPHLERLIGKMVIELRRDGVEPTEYQRKDVFLKAVARARGKKRGNTKALGNLWRAGYIDRIGSIYVQTGRPFNTRWRISPDYVGKSSGGVIKVQGVR